MMTTTTAMMRGIKCSHPIGLTRWSGTSHSEDPPHLHRQSSCTSRLVGDLDRAPLQSLHTYRHPAPRDRPEGTALTLPGASTIEPLYLPASYTIEWPATHRPTHHHPMPSITIIPSHRLPTPPEKRQEHIRRAVRPLSRSLFIERSECFPHCLLEIPLATPWPKQTLRPANRTYSPIFDFS